MGDDWRGINASEAASRLTAEGPNALPRDAERGWASILWEVVREPMLLLLLVAAGTYLVVGDLGEGIALLVASVGVVVITLVQRGRSEHALAALRDLSSPRAQVLRDGVAMTIPAAELVRGDIIRIGEGDRIPADAVLRDGSGVASDESLLTGESVPVSKHPDTTASTLGPPGGDGNAWLFSGSLVVAGRGVAEVLATGPRSELGRIGRSLGELRTERSPLQREVARTVLRVAILALSLSLALAVIVILRDGGFTEGLLAGLTLAMSLMPEEMPVVLMVFLALGAWRIAKQGVLTRQTVAIERLGAIDVLCTDKTGTLTQNRMTVSQLWPVGPDQGAAARDTGEALTVEGTDDLPEHVHELVEYAILACPRDPFDPMEKAFHALGKRTLATTEHLHSDWSDVREYPLTPELLAVTHLWRAPDHRDLIVATKGAPIAIFALCKLAPDVLLLWSERAAAMARVGLRVLAVARGSNDVAAAPEDPRTLAFNFLGLVGLHDPLREGVREAVALCQGAGMRVMMITGDHPETARAIAAQAGIKEGEVLLGSELEQLDDATLAARMLRTSIVARAVPAHKLRIVQGMRAAGQRVAMTGDGVNDSPALKAADVGIAMGRRGTDVAREAAALVLVDDDFGAIVAAVALGRRIFENLRRAFGYIVSVHIPIAGLALLPPLFGWETLLGPIQVVFMELVIDPACSIVLELEPAHRDIMKRPPRPPKAHLFDGPRLLWSVLQGAALLISLLGLVAVLHGLGMPASETRSLAFVGLVVGNLALLIASRSSQDPFWKTLGRKNPTVPWLIGITLVLLTVMTLVPPVAHLLGLGAELDIGVPLALGFGIVPVLALDVVESWVVRRRSLRRL